MQYITKILKRAIDDHGLSLTEKLLRVIQVRGYISNTHWGGDQKGPRKLNRARGPLCLL